MTDTQTVRAHVTITGVVQGVYFRSSAADEARFFGLAGWVRNTAQGVEAVFEGPRPAVEQMIAWCHEGPRRATVDRVDVTWEDSQGLSGFIVRH
jgi:acylphosphatase